MVVIGTARFAPVGLAGPLQHLLQPALASDCCKSPLPSPASRRGPTWAAWRWGPGRIQSPGRERHPACTAPAPAPWLWVICILQGRSISLLGAPLRAPAVKAPPTPAGNRGTWHRLH